MDMLKQIGLKHASAVIVVVLIFLGIEEKTARKYAPEIESAIETYIDVETEAPGDISELIVQKVYDGDTVTVTSGERLRLVGINAPEVNEPFADDSQKYLTSLVLGKKITVTHDVTKRDQYDRLLVYMYVDDLFVNETMVRQGLAKAVEYYPDVSKKDVFAAAERSAKYESLGIWSE